jgi:hypothetical protein
MEVEWSALVRRVFSEEVASTMSVIPDRRKRE